MNIAEILKKKMTDEEIKCAEKWALSKMDILEGDEHLDTGLQQPAYTDTSSFAMVGFSNIGYSRVVGTDMECIDAVVQDKNGKFWFMDFDNGIICDGEVSLVQRGDRVFVDHVEYGHGDRDNAYTDWESAIAHPAKDFENSLFKANPSTVFETGMHSFAANNIVLILQCNVNKEFNKFFEQDLSNPAKGSYKRMIKALRISDRELKDCGYIRSFKDYRLDFDELDQYVEAAKESIRAAKRARGEAVPKINRYAAIQSPK